MDEKMKQGLDEATDEVVAGMIMKAIIEKFTEDNFSHFFYATTIVLELKRMVADGYVTKDRAKLITKELANIFDESIINLVEIGEVGGYR